MASDRNLGATASRSTTMRAAQSTTAAAPKTAEDIQAEKAAEAVRQYVNTPTAAQKAQQNQQPTPVPQQTQPVMANSVVLAGAQANEQQARTRAIAAALSASPLAGPAATAAAAVAFMEKQARDATPTSRVLAASQQEKWRDVELAEALVKFNETAEGGHTRLFHDVKVYIQGVDVSPWLSGAVSITLAERDGLNVASITLDNVADRWILTEDNLGLSKRFGGEPMFRLDDLRTSERAKQDIYLYKATFSDPASSSAEAVAKRFQRLASGQNGTVSLFKARKIATAQSYDLLDHDALMRIALASVPISQLLAPKSRAELKRQLANVMSKIGLEKIEPAAARERAAELRRAVDDAVSANQCKKSDMLDKVAGPMAERAAAANAQGSGPRSSIDDAVISRSDAEELFDDYVAETLAKVKNPKFRSWSRNKQLIALRAQNETRIDQLGLRVGTFITPSVGRQAIPQTQRLDDRGSPRRNVSDPDTGDRVWPLNVRSCIIQRMDPIVIFVKNPHTENDDQWVFGFTGYVDNVSVHRDYINGLSHVSVTAGDIRMVMRKMRVSFNPIIGIPVQEPVFTQRGALFSDLIEPMNLTSPFANLPFEEAVALLITGGTVQQATGTMPLKGVGEFKLDRVVTFPTADDDVEGSGTINSLEDWHTRCFTHTGSWLTAADVDKIGRAVTSNGEWAPHRRGLNMLIPKEGTGVSSLLSYNFQAGSDRREWVDRAQIMSELVQSIDYQWWVTPVGDIVVEFPMYDFAPDDFGDWEPLFTVDHHLTAGEFSDLEGDVPTAMIVTGALSTFAPANPALPEGAQPRAFVQSSIMQARLGTYIETVSKPFVSDPDVLQCLAIVEFQKRLARTNRLDMQLVYRFFLAPNRPMLNAVEQRMGLVYTTNYNWQVLGQAGVGVALRYVRQIRNDGTFRHITGGVRMPVSYKDVTKNGSCANLTSSGVRAGGNYTKLKERELKAPSRPLPRLVETVRGRFEKLDPVTQQMANALSECLPGGRGIVMFSGKRRRADGRADLPAQTKSYHFSGRAIDIRPWDDRGIDFTIADRNALAACAARFGYMMLDERQTSPIHYHFQPGGAKVVNGQPRIEIRDYRNGKLGFVCDVGCNNRKK